MKDKIITLLSYIIPLLIFIDMTFKLTPIADFSIVVGGLYTILIFGIQISLVFLIGFISYNFKRLSDDEKKKAREIGSKHYSYISVLFYLISSIILSLGHFYILSSLILISGMLFLLSSSIIRSKFYE